MKNKQKEYFKLFANCIPVKGYKNSVIYDLQRNDFYEITNHLYDTLPEIESFSTEEIADANPELASFLDVLVKDEIGFYCTEPDRFPGINTNWEVPNIITNAVIEHAEKSNHDYQLMFKSLDSVFCRNILIMFYNLPTEIELNYIFESAAKYNIHFIELWFSSIFNTKKITKKYKNIRKIVTINSKVEKNKEENYVKKIFVRHKSFKALCSGTPPNKILNLNFYNESLMFNNCLNKKLAIDKDRNVKNCPFFDKSYGDYKDNNIFTISNSENFQKLWHINKDKINECKDCQYRYMCKDCRAFTKGNDILDKPIFCHFNPYSEKK